MAEEAFLWGIIPAAAPAGYGLPDYSARSEHALKRVQRMPTAV